MKPLHLAVLVTTALSYFTLAVLIAKPDMFGL